MLPTVQTKNSYTTKNKGLKYVRIPVEDVIVPNIIPAEFEAVLSKFPSFTGEALLEQSLLEQAKKCIKTNNIHDLTELIGDIAKARHTALYDTQDLKQADQLYFISCWFSAVKILTVLKKDPNGALLSAVEAQTNFINNSEQNFISSITREYPIIGNRKKEV